MIIINDFSDFPDDMHRRFLHELYINSAAIGVANCNSLCYHKFLFSSSSSSPSTVRFYAHKSLTHVTGITLYHTHQTYGSNSHDFRSLHRRFDANLNINILLFVHKTAFEFVFFYGKIFSSSQMKVMLNHRSILIFIMINTTHFR